MKYFTFLFFFSFTLIKSNYAQSIANFVIPDTVCVNQNIGIQNTSTGGSTYYWNFCSGNLSNTPIGLNLGNIGSLNKPVFSSIVKDSNNFYIFISNIQDGTITRLSFGNSLINTPVATNLGTLGVLGMYIEGIQINKDSLSGNWYGFVSGGQLNYLARLFFGSSLNNTPTATNLGNISGLLNYSLPIYNFYEGGNWYSFVANSSTSSSIIRLNYGNSLANIPTAINLGNIGSLNSPAGFCPIFVNGNWYLFIVNTNNNTLSRLYFGNSLLNTPTGINLGNISNTFNLPRSISIQNDCNQIVAFVTNESTNNLVKLTFPGGITSSPTGVSLGNIANFSFPHSISQIFRVGDSLYSFIMNVNNNSISRLCFTGCANSSITSSSLQTPPVYSYNATGTYNVSLTVNEGLISQSKICKDIVVVTLSNPIISGDTVICTGDSLKLISSATPGCSYLWTGPNGFTSTNQNVIIPTINASNVGTYTLVISKNGCTSTPVSRMVSFAQKPVVNLGNDTIIPCTSSSINFILNAGNPACTYYWSSGQTTQSINVYASGNYSVKVTNSAGCYSSDTINIIVTPTNANFTSPDTVCVNQNIAIQNTTLCGNTYYWNFCSGNLLNTPIGLNMGNIGALNQPVYSSIAKDGSNYYVFISNINNGTITRLSFGTSLTNTPIATNIGNFGVMGMYIEGIQIKKDSLTGNWFGFIVGGQMNYLARLSFGSSLSNIPTAVNLGNISNLMNYSHTIYTFIEGGNWYSLVGNFGNSTLLKLNFGNSLGNTPTAISLGNIGGLSGPVGLYPIQENGNWYLFVANQNNSTLSRLNFGNSLLNLPSGVNLGNINGTMNDPRAITIIRDCGHIVGYVTNEITNDIVRLTFPGSLTSIPTGVSLGNLANFSFPHHISEVFRVGDSLYAFIMNVNNSTISRLCFPSCNNSSVSSSILQNPPAFSYNLPGTYNVSLVVNEGLLSQSNICKQVVVVGLSSPLIIGDTTLCIGDSLILTSNAIPACTYQWTGPNGFTSSNQNVIIPNTTSGNAGIYTLTIAKNGCSSMPVTRIVSIALKPILNLGNDTSICQSNHLVLNAYNPGCTYAWNTGVYSQTLNINAQGTYSVKVTNTSGCYVRDTIIVNLLTNPLVNLGDDTTICQGNHLILNANNLGSTYLWNTGPTTQTINVTTSGSYSVKVTNNSGCYAKDTLIVNIVPGPIVNLGNDTSICQGTEIILNAGNTGSNYLWNNGLNSQTINVQNSGLYWVEVNNNNCYGSDTINVNTIPNPIIYLGNDTIMCPGELIVLRAGTGFSQYLWSDGSNLNHLNVYNQGTYSVIVYNGLCSATDEIFIDECSSEISVPNVFTPNGDGINEYFAPTCTNIDKITLYIYNRWGNQLYNGSGISASWDGKYKDKLCPDGVYYYLIDYEQKGSSKGMRQIHGSVTLLK